LIDSKQFLCLDLLKKIKSILRLSQTNNVLSFHTVTIMQPHAQESSNVDRLQFLFMNLVGHVVSVHAVDGSITEGLFVSRTDDDASEPSIMLSKTRNRRSATCAVDEKTTMCEIMLVPLASVVFVNAVGVRVEAAASGRVGHFRSSVLEMNWADLPPEDERTGVTGNLEDEERNWETGKWDQFETNAKKFGVKTTYKEEMYTTTLDKTKLSKEQIEYADRAAREIERSQARGVQHRIERGEDVDVDEGTLYSDVQRGQAPGDVARKAPAAPCAVGTTSRSIGVAQTGVLETTSHRPYRRATSMLTAMAASLDRRADASRRCAPDWPSDGGGPYDVEDSAYKLHYDEHSKQDHRHHPHHHVHPAAGQPLGYGGAPHQSHALTSSTGHQVRGPRYVGRGGGSQYQQQPPQFAHGGRGAGGMPQRSQQQQQQQQQQHHISAAPPPPHPHHHHLQHMSGGSPKTVQPQQPVPAAAPNQHEPHAKRGPFPGAPA
jgi:hypothetical protein